MTGTPLPLGARLSLEDDPEVEVRPECPPIEGGGGGAEPDPRGILGGNGGGSDSARKRDSG